MVNDKYKIIKSLSEDAPDIIGIPACQFDLDGKHLIAMPPDAPFYQGLMNRK